MSEPNDELRPEVTRRRMIKRARHIVQECRQAVIDAASWNDAHPDDTPLDVEDFRLMGRYAEHVLSELGVSIE